MSGMTSGVCVESDLSSMLQRSSAPSHHHHHPNHHGYSGQGQGLSPMLDYSSEMDRYRSSIASFYKSNVNMNVSNFPQSAKLAAIFPPAAAARLGAMATAPWGCHDNVNNHHHHAAAAIMQQGEGGGGAEKHGHTSLPVSSQHHHGNGNFLYGGDCNNVKHQQHHHQQGGLGPAPSDFVGLSEGGGRNVGSGFLAGLPPGVIVMAMGSSGGGISDASAFQMTGGGGSSPSCSASPSSGVTAAGGSVASSSLGAVAKRKRKRCGVCSPCRRLINCGRPPSVPTGEAFRWFF
ncbi:CXXC-type zinc finger protein 4 [Dissostichus eleginoides]|uniref:CXXC-type zinc finger protein 4 n=1 Tax=Dissostichus eleginoides TaxID=100907 RepID=A0AAD9BYC3_DISEL|nr:CXXC-type zinc finger protein 4 [Dissostichus eleginoides]